MKAEELEKRNSDLKTMLDKSDNDNQSKDKEIKRMKEYISNLEQDCNEKDKTIEEMQKGEGNSEQLKQMKDSFNIKVQENFNLKQTIDDQRGEITKLKKRVEAMHD